MTCITALLHEGKYSELSRYIEETNKGIAFVVKINDLSNIGITDEDIVVILSNLLNNAIEACEQCESKMIKLKFAQQEEKNMVVLP